MRGQRMTTTLRTSDQKHFNQTFVGTIVEGLEKLK